MATTFKKTITSNNLLTITDVTWTQRETIEASIQEIGCIRFSYLDGVLEIMNLSLASNYQKYLNPLGKSLLKCYVN